MIDSAKMHLQRSLKEGMRLDGRKPDQYRNITLETGVIRNAEGSARVRMGNTEILAGVKMAVEPPYPDTPDEGIMMVGVELLPMSDPEFEPGPPSIQAVELARVVDRGIREAKTIDVKKLCLMPREKVWAVMLDIVTMNVDGNLFDAAGLAAIAAIRDAKLPRYSKEEGVNYKEITKEHLPLSKVPIPVTVYKAGSVFLIDPTEEEEAAVDARLTAAVMEDGRLCALQKGGDDALTPREVDAMVSLAIEKSKELRKHVK